MTKLAKSFWPARNLTMKWEPWIEVVGRELGLSSFLSVDSMRIGELLGDEYPDDTTAVFDAEEKRQALPKRERAKKDAEQLKAWPVRLGIPPASKDLVISVAKRFKNSTRGRKMRRKVGKEERRRAAARRL